MLFQLEDIKFDSWYGFIEPCVPLLYMQLDVGATTSYNTYLVLFPSFFLSDNKLLLQQKKHHDVASTLNISTNHLNIINNKLEKH